VDKVRRDFMNERGAARMHDAMLSDIAFCEQDGDLFLTCYDNDDHLRIVADEVYGLMVAAGLQKEVANNSDYKRHDTEDGELVWAWWTNLEDEADRLLAEMFGVEHDPYHHDPTLDAVTPEQRAVYHQRLEEYVRSMKWLNVPKGE
jgi:hypothetical protein